MGELKKFGLVSLISGLIISGITSIKIDNIVPYSETLKYAHKMGYISDERYEQEGKDRGKIFWADEFDEYNKRISPYDQFAGALIGLGLAFLYKSRKSG